jgi:hypothetical protein
MNVQSDADTSGGFTADLTDVLQQRCITNFGINVIIAPKCRPCCEVFVTALSTTCFVRGMTNNEEDYITDLVCFFVSVFHMIKTMKLNTEAPPTKVLPLVFKTPKRILIGEYLIAKPTGFRGSSNSAAKPIYNNTYFVKKESEGNYVIIV